MVERLDLEIGQKRLAVVGPNGSGKTRLLRVILGEDSPAHGAARRQRAHIGAIAQGGVDWMTEESLLEFLIRTTNCGGPDEVAQVLVAHRFPLALATRGMASLSPGERTRAALICLCQRRPQVELLVLDEPTYTLDFVSAAVLLTVLQTWRGGFVVASHDTDVLAQLEMDSTLQLPYLQDTGDSLKTTD